MTNQQTQRIIQELNLMIDNQLPDLSIHKKIAIAFNDWFLDIICDME